MVPHALGRRSCQACVSCGEQMSRGRPCNTAAVSLGDRQSVVTSTGTQQHPLPEAAYIEGTRT